MALNNSHGTQVNQRKTFNRIGWYDSFVSTGCDTRAIFFTLVNMIVPHLANLHLWMRGYT